MSKSEVEQESPLPSKSWMAATRKNLLAWFKTAAREMPWRSDPTPYRVWISEIMLQQTQVATVIPYFERFLASFPDVATLAAAEEQDVLRHWEGLGYYRRARQLHAAAKKIVEEHDGEFPTNFDDVLALPGIGRYTAGAILSISLDKRHPILEANTIRVYSRLLEYQGDPLSSSGQNLLWEFAEAILPRTNSRNVNQAMMELGSEICFPKRPACLICPLTSLCPTKAAGLQDKIPRPKPKKKFEEVTECAVVISHQNKYLMRCCQPGERWAGLWDFIRFPLPESGIQDEDQLLQTIAQQVSDLTGITIAPPQQVAQIKHGVTRFKITLRCFTTQKRSGRLKRDGHCKWSTAEEVQELPLSTTGRKLAKTILATT